MNEGEKSARRIAAASMWKLDLVEQLASPPTLELFVALHCNRDDHHESTDAFAECGTLVWTPLAELLPFKRATELTFSIAEELLAGRIERNRSYTDGIVRGLVATFEPRTCRFCRQRSNPPNAVGLVDCTYCEGRGVEPNVAFESRCRVCDGVGKLHPSKLTAAAQLGDHEGQPS